MGEGAHARIVALDLTKGVLVIFMVLYHSSNYSTERQLGFEYFAFLPPSFILITGFLVSRAYLLRKSSAGPRLYFRLFIRGARLLALFTILNVLAQSLIRDRARGQMPGLDVFWDEWFGVYVTGNARLATFEVLLPIAYFLLLSPIFVFVGRFRRVVFVVLAGLALGIVIWTGWQGVGWANVQFVACGLLGMVFGCLPWERLRGIVLLRCAAVLAYAGYMSLATTFGNSFLVQLLGSCLALTLIFSFCLWIRPDSWGGRRLELLGRYSLVAYIVQIVFLYILARFFGRPEPLSIEFVVLLTSAWALTQAFVEILDWTRVRLKWTDSLYTAVFA